MSTGGPASAVPTSTTGTSQFASAASQPDGTPTENPTVVPQETTPENPRVKVKFDANTGTPYVFDPVTGQRYDVSDDESVMPHIRGTTTSQQGSPEPNAGTTLTGTPSEVSDMTADSALTSEGLLAALITDVRTTDLTDAQLTRFNVLRAMLSLGRESLLTTTALVVGQDLTLAGIEGSIRALRNEMAERIEELSDSMMSAEARIAATLENNI
ncbi:hypothetical protein DFH06DRAFT_1151879 [Mycena polygramma]|nr:hypothetical protein DFH06DRAFT_1151879 [Mycena polygramma]